MFVERSGLSPACRIILFPISLCSSSQTGLCIFHDGTLLSSVFLGEFFWRLLFVKIITSADGFGFVAPFYCIRAFGIENTNTYAINGIVFNEEQN